MPIISESESLSNSYPYSVIGISHDLGRFDSRLLQVTTLAAACVLTTRHWQAVSDRPCAVTAYAPSTGTRMGVRSCVTLPRLTSESHRKHTLLASSDVYPAAVHMARASNLSDRPFPSCERMLRSQPADRIGMVRRCPRAPYCNV